MKCMPLSSGVPTVTLLDVVTSLLVVVISPTGLSLRRTPGLGFLFQDPVQSAFDGLPDTLSQVVPNGLLFEYNDEFGHDPAS